MLIAEVNNVGSLCIHMELLSPSFGIIVATLLSFGFLVLTILALISSLKATFQDTTTKLIWVIVIVSIPVVGAILYFSIGRKQRISAS